jgi:pseudaminic acid synthase
MFEFITNRSTFVVAELSANHNHNFDLAVKTIKAMADSGADAVKIQTYRPESLTLDLSTGYFSPLTEGLWKDSTPWQLFKEGSMPYEWQPKLMEVAKNMGLLFFSSPFDVEGVDFLQKMRVPIFKVASPEITDIPLIRHIAKQGKPMFISLGMAGKEDIELAVHTCKEMGNEQIILLKCTAQYPATVSDANLLTIPDIKAKYGLPVGLSDHTMNTILPIVAVSLGAVVVEKHFILDRKLGGPDSAFSLEPHEFKQMVDQIRETEKCLGNISYDVDDKDKLRRRSLFVVETIRAGEVINERNVKSIRPGYGLHPKYLNAVMGLKSKTDIEKGTPLNWVDLDINK